MKDDLFTVLAEDKIIHERARLRLLTYLAAADEEVSFSELREKLELSAGNLSVQLKTLGRAGYVAIQKQFKDNKPLTTVVITVQGSAALKKYLSEMERVIMALKDD